MEDPTSPTNHPSTEPATPRTRGLAQSLGEQRRQIEEFLASRRERMDGVEPKLTDVVARIVDELIRSRSETSIAKNEQESREARLQQETKHIEQMRADLDAAHDDWEQTRRATEKQQSMLLEKIQNQLQEQPPQMDADSAGELEELRGQCRELRRELDRQPQVAANHSEELDRLATERDAAVKSLDESERLLSEAKNQMADTASAGASPDVAEYEQRYALSLEDIHELKAETKTLKEELAIAKSREQSAGADASSADGQLSWEAQKKKLIASLESQYDEDEPKDVEQRMQIDEIIQQTNLAISQKDNEIKELERILEHQSENIGSVAVGAAAFGEMLDNDQIIQDERESLKNLQEELRRKLSAAEIDISLERARMARERVELEEKMRMMAQQQTRITPSKKEPDEEEEKPVRGRWLSRLGLNDIDP